MEIHQYGVSGKRKKPIRLVTRHYIVWMGLRNFDAPASLAELTCRVQSLYPAEREVLNTKCVRDALGELVMMGLAEKIDIGLTRKTDREWPTDTTFAASISGIMEQLKGGGLQRRPIRFGAIETDVFDYLVAHGTSSVADIAHERAGAVREALFSLKNKKLVDTDGRKWFVLEGASISPYAPGTVTATKPTGTLQAAELRAALKAVYSKLDWAVSRQLTLQQPYPPRVQEWLEQSTEILEKTKHLSQ